MPKSIPYRVNISLFERQFAEKMDNLRESFTTPYQDDYLTEMLVARDALHHHPEFANFKKTRGFIKFIYGDN